MTISLALETIGEIDRVKDASPTCVADMGRSRRRRPARPVWASIRWSRCAVRKVYDGLGHEILNEPVGLDIADEMAAWIEQTLGL